MANEKCTVDGTVKSSVVGGSLKRTTLLFCLPLLVALLCIGYLHCIVDNLGRYATSLKVLPESADIVPLLFPPIIAKNILEPQRVLEEYKAQHSIYALSKESNVSLRSRRYAVVAYSCPPRAGIILHSYFNQILWAVLTNRTLLVRYDTKQPLRYRQTKEGCHAVARQAAWLPNYEDWVERIWNSDYTPVPLSHSAMKQLYDVYRSTDSPKINTSLVATAQLPVVIFPSLGTVHFMKAIDKNVTRWGWDHGPYKFPRSNTLHFDDLLVDNDTFLGQHDGDDLLSAQIRQGRRRVRGLYKEGIDFLFGMMFRETFDVQVHPSTKVLQKIDPQRLQRLVAFPAYRCR